MGLISLTLQSPFDSPWSKQKSVQHFLALVTSDAWIETSKLFQYFGLVIQTPTLIFVEGGVFSFCFEVLWFFLFLYFDKFHYFEYIFILVIRQVLHPPSRRESRKEGSKSLLIPKTLEVLSALFSLDRSSYHGAFGLFCVQYTTCVFVNSDNVKYFKLIESSNASCLLMSSIRYPV